MLDQLNVSIEYHEEESYSPEEALKLQIAMWKGIPRDRLDEIELTDDQKQNLEAYSGPIGTVENQLDFIFKAVPDTSRPRFAFNIPKGGDGMVFGNRQDFDNCVRNDNGQFFAFDVTRRMFSPQGQLITLYATAKAFNPNVLKGMVHCLRSDGLDLFMLKILPTCPAGELYPFAKSIVNTSRIPVAIVDQRKTLDD